MAVNSLRRSVLQARSGQPPEHALRAFQRSQHRARREALLAMGKILRAEMRATVGQSGPSKPGDPPAKATGKLQRSMQYGFVKGVLRVGTGYFVGRLLQHGVFSDRRIVLPRPWAEVSLQRAEDKLPIELIAALRSVGTKS